jgi:uncharacterized membrane protein YcaP (DUF421 family)
VGAGAGQLVKGPVQLGLVAGTEDQPGAVLVGTLVFWNYLLDWLAYRIRWVRRLTHPGPLLLVQEGKLLRRNMRQELITEAELWTELRKQGVEQLDEVAKAFMEGDGRISVIKKQSSPEEQHVAQEHRAAQGS